MYRYQKKIILQDLDKKMVLHKMPQWKSFIKGIYDKKLPHQRILVTGSARLNTFRHTGDALTGRFFTHRLLPLSMKELSFVGDMPDMQTLISAAFFLNPIWAQMNTILPVGDAIMSMD